MHETTRDLLINLMREIPSALFDAACIVAFLAFIAAVTP